MITRFVSIMLSVALMASCAVTNPDLPKTAVQPAGCPSVEALAEAIWNAHKTRNAQLLLPLIDYTGTDVKETRKSHTLVFDERQTMDPSSASILAFQQAEADVFRVRGMQFNLNPVAKVRIEYQALIDTEIKREVNGMLLSLPAILYYYVGRKNERYFIASVVPLKAETGQKADNSGRNSDSDIIMAIPVDGANAPTSASGANTVIILDADDLSNTKPSTSPETPKQENILLTAAFWKKATLDDVKKALDAGFDIHAQGPDDEIVLTLAAAHGQNPDLIDLLISHGANINVQDRFGLTPLMAAAGSNPNPAMVERLIDKGADLHVTDIDGSTALAYAATENPNLELIDLLVSKGLDVRKKSKYGDPLIVYAAVHHQNPDVIDRLIKLGADVHQRDSSKRTPLIAAAYSNPNPGMIDRLIKFGADIEARDEDGMTPLACAASLNENPEVLERLIQHGANIGATDNDGHSVLFWAEENRYLRDTTVSSVIRQELSQ